LTRASKWIVGVVAALILLVIAAALALPLVVDTPRVQALILSSASQALGRPVKFASVSVAVLPTPAVRLHELEIADDPQFDSAPFLKLETGRLALKLRGLLAGRVEFGDLTLKRPVITLIRNPEGVLNIASLGASPKPKSPGRGARTTGSAGGAGASTVLPGRVKIERGTVTYIVRGKGGAPSRYRVEDLDLTLDGSGGALTVEGAARVKPGDLGVTLAEGRIALNAGRSLLEAPVTARLGLDGKDVAELVAASVGPTPSIGGPVKGMFSLSGTLGAPKATGTLELASARVTEEVAGCPEPRRRTLTLTALKLDGTSWDGGRLTSRPVTTSLAGGSVRLNLGATLDRGVRVELADLSIKGLPLERVLVDFLCQGYAVSGPLDLDGALAFGASDLWGTLFGPGRLRIGPGRVVGARALELLGNVVRIGGAVSSLLNADLPLSLFTSPLDFDSITGTYVITNGVVRTRDLLYTSRVMKVAIAGEYGLASGRMALDMVVSHGRGEVAARVTGTAAAPSIRVDPSSLVRDLDRQKVESGLKDLLKRFR
jgi:AsmA protein